MSNVRWSARLGAALAISLSAAACSSADPSADPVQTETLSSALSALPTTCLSAPVVTGAREINDVATSWNNGNQTAISVLRSTAAGFNSPVAETTTGGWASGATWVEGDFTGDGRGDLAAIWNDGGYATVAVRPSFDGAFPAKTWATRVTPFTAGTQWLPGDFDGDGRVDLAFAVNDYGLTSIYVMFAQSSSTFAAPLAWLTRIGVWPGDARWTVGDFDGNGLADIATIWNDGGYNTVTVHASTGRRFTTSDWATRQGGWLASTAWLAGDFDGDHRGDLVAAWNNGGLTATAVLRGYVTATGGAFYNPVQWTTGGGWAPGAKWSAADFDGNGKTDLLAVWNNNGLNSLAVRTSTGSSFPASNWITTGTWSDDAAWCSGKFHLF